MTAEPQALLIAAVAAVGILHTMVPDHWAPIVAIARQRGWSAAETARAAIGAGAGHVGSTLLIGIAVWLAGIAAATRLGHLIDTLSSLALIGFGGWIALSAWRERAGSAGHGHRHARHPHHPHDDKHPHDRAHAFAGDPLYLPLPAGTAGLTRHVHRHRHGAGAAHLHWHDHSAQTAHPLGAAIDAPLHEHRHRTTARTALVLILGSSPMIEGIPAFFAAAQYGAGLIAAMAAVFAIATIGTYTVLCLASRAGLQRLRFAAFEAYGEILSGAFIALVGAAFLLWPEF